MFLVGSHVLLSTFVAIVTAVTVVTFPTTCLAVCVLGQQISNPAWYTPKYFYHNILRIYFVFFELKQARRAHLHPAITAYPHFILNSKPSTYRGVELVVQLFRYDRRDGSSHSA